MPEPRAEKPNSNQQIMSALTPQSNSKPPPYIIPVWQYDVLQGVAHGTLQAVATGVLLNPFDKYHLRYVGNREMGKGFCAFIGAITQDPCRGTCYTIRTNLPRNWAVFTALPFVRDELQQYDISPRNSKIISGIGAGTLESAFTAANVVKRSIIYIEDKQQAEIKGKTSFKSIWRNLSASEQYNLKKPAFLWGACRGAIYWMGVPVLSEFFEQQFKTFPLAKSHSNIDYILAGAAAGGLTAIVSYPFDVLQKRSIACQYEQYKAGITANKKAYKDLVGCAIKETTAFYQAHGLWKTITQNTHKGFSLAFGRVAASTGMLNFTLHGAQQTCDTLFEKEMNERTCSLQK